MFLEQCFSNEWFCATFAFFASLLVLKIFKDFGIRKIRQLAVRTQNDFDDFLIEAISKVGWPFYVIISLFISFHFIILNTDFERFFRYVALIVIVYYFVKFFQELITYWIDKAAQGQEEKGKKTDVSALKLLGSFIKWVLWIIAGLLVLQNLGVNITALVAGVGIGGIAIAFALQSVLEDLFSCFTIYFDRPFEVGDFIVFGTEMGTVNKIGLKSTRIKTLKGDELVISNKQLTGSTIHNYKKIKKRRAGFEIRVSQDTKYAKLSKIKPEIVKIFSKEKGAELNRAHLRTIASGAYIFEVVYYVNTGEYSSYMDIQERINMEIKKFFEKNKINFAFPLEEFMKK